MIRFAKERSDKTEDGSGWIALRAKVLKLSDQFELKPSKRLHGFLDLAVQLFMLTCGLVKNSPNVIGHNPNGLAQVLVPLPSGDAEIGKALLEAPKTYVNHVKAYFIGVCDLAAVLAFHLAGQPLFQFCCTVFQRRKLSKQGGRVEVCILPVLFPVGKVRHVFRFKRSFKPLNWLEYISLQPRDTLRKRHVEWGQSETVGRCLDTPAYL